MIAALYVVAGGCYSGLAGVDAWPYERDARTYPGPYPVVAHPPCGRWCMPLAKVNEVRYGHKVGDDDGCFQAALQAVRTWGGVLEHPANSAAWPTFGLQPPLRGAWSRSMFGDPGWVTCVSQVAYGHRARKRTWLYYVGDREPPAMDWSEPKARTVVAQLPAATNARRGLERMGKQEALATPPAFRDALIELALWARA